MAKEEEMEKLDEARKRYPEKFAPENVVFSHIHRGSRIFVGTGASLNTSFAPSFGMWNPILPPFSMTQKLSPSELGLDRLIIDPSTLLLEKGIIEK